MLALGLASCAIDRVDIRLATDGGASDGPPPQTDVSSLDLGPGDVALDAATPADVALRDLGVPDIAHDAPALDRPAAPDVPSPTARSCAGAAPPGCGRVRLGGGPVVLGDAEASDPGASGGRALPLQTMVSVGALEVDRFEVTVGRFRRFVMATRVASGFDARDGSHEHCNWTTAATDREAHPMNCVDWQTAAAFCAWDELRGRLPTEAEWELAARGGGARPWPWSAAAPTPPRACFNRCETGRCEGTCPAEGAGFETGQSPEGVWHLAGNVAEWVVDWYRPYENRDCWGDRLQRDPRCDIKSGERCVRGGSWESVEAAALRGAARLDVGREDRAATVGFRCIVPAT